MYFYIEMAFCVFIIFVIGYLCLLGVLDDN